ncbi:MAG: hypothetical protein K2W95_32735 [Candidatus Obscuribacterales bacterium]|nr:hypothetical protein [Candidatus Obscuribacterales bacterium]
MSYDVRKDLRFFPENPSSDLDELIAQLQQSRHQIGEEFARRLEIGFLNSAGQRTPKGSRTLQTLMSAQTDLLNILMRYWETRGVMGGTGLLVPGHRRSLLDHVRETKRRLESFKEMIYERGGHTLHLAFSAARPDGLDFSLLSGNTLGNTTSDMQSMTAHWAAQLQLTEAFLQEQPHEPELNSRLRLAEMLADQMSALGLTVSDSSKGHFLKVLDAAMQTLHVQDDDQAAPMYLVRLVVAARKKHSGQNNDEIDYEAAPDAMLGSFRSSHQEADVSPALGTLSVCAQPNCAERERGGGPGCPACVIAFNIYMNRVLAETDRKDEEKF